MKYLGNIAAGRTISFLFATNDGGGAAVAPVTAGTISVYKDNDTAETAAGVTYATSFDGLTGVNSVTIATSDPFYTAGHDFTVVLAGAVIDGETVNAVLAVFSIENRLPAAPDNQGITDAKTAAQSVAALIETADGHGRFKASALESAPAAPTADQNAAAAATAVLATPANKLATDALGQVTTSNPGGLTSEQSNLLASISQTAGTLTTTERNAVADALLGRANAVDGKTVQQALQIMAAVLAGKISGAGSGTETFKGLDGATVRAVVSTDADANRTNVQYYP